MCRTEPGLVSLKHDLSQGADPDQLGQRLRVIVSQLLSSDPEIEEEAGSAGPSGVGPQLPDA